MRTGPIFTLLRLMRRGETSSPHQTVWCPHGSDTTTLDFDAVAPRATPCRVGRVELHREPLPSSWSQYMTHPLFDRLAAGPVLADGAMGTMLYAAGASLDESFDALNVSRPDMVLAVHRAYL